MISRHEARMIAEEVVKLMRNDNPLGLDAPMDSREAAAYLKMSFSHFSHIAPRLPRVKSGKRWLYPRQELDRLLINNEL